MKAMRLEIPSEVVDGLRLPPGEIEPRLRRELAVRLYEKGILNFSLARRLAGMTRWSFHEWLGEQRVLRSYDGDDLADDIGATRGLP